MNQSDEYLVARLHEALLADERLHDQALEVQVVGDAVVVRGEVATPQRRDSVLEIVARLAPGAKVIADIQVPHVGEPQSEPL